jgi:hypothetical protein
MISLFGAVSLVVLAVCVGGLVLHRFVMKCRTRLDTAENTLDCLAEDEEIETIRSAQEEYNNALADYHRCVSRFPGNIAAKVFGLPL